MPDDDTTTPPGPDDTPDPTAGQTPDTTMGTTPPGGPDTPDGTATPAGTAPTVLTRKERRAERGRRRTLWWILAGVGILLVAGVLVATLADGSPAEQAVPTTTTSSTVPAVVATCPLTGAPAPGGTVPPRPAVAVKIGNYTDDRPSAGLNQADLVVEEPVEGSYTRLVAVFQCQTASLVGDLRSARQPDVGILSQLSNPVFVHAGDIGPVQSLLDNAPLQDRNLLQGGMGSITLHPSGRYAPYSTFTDTTAVWATVPGDTTPPAPLFTYSPAPPVGAVPGSGLTVHVPFSTEADVTWTWNPSTATYLRSYSGVADKLLDGAQTATANVVVMTVPTSIGPWYENSEGGREVEVDATGSGPVVVLRDGVAVTGTWTRPSLTAPATLTVADGTPITLRPGSTWIELAPQGIPVTTTAAPAPAPTTTRPSTTRTTPPTTRG
jgi:hypothetical protein